MFCSDSFSPRCGSLLPLRTPSSESCDADSRLCYFSFWKRRLWRSHQRSLCDAETTLFYFVGQCVQAILLKTVPFCKLSAGLGSTNKIATAFLFSSQTPVLSLPRFPLLRSAFYPHSVAEQARTILLLLLLYYQATIGGLVTHLFRGMTRLMSWSVECAAPAIHCPMQSLFPYLSYPLFSFWDLRRTVLSKFVDTQVSSISNKKLVLPCHPCYVLSRLRCYKRSPLLNLYLSRIDGIENTLCSACGQPTHNISHLILHCPATNSLRCLLFGDFLSLYDLWARF